MKIILKSFNTLSNQELYQLLKLRYDVFVKEQQSIYDEFDSLDQEATHFLLIKPQQLVGYARSYLKSKTIGVFGRVVIHPNYRGQGLGKQLIRQVVESLKQNSNVEKIKISAQIQLQSLYQYFGFISIGKPYNDFGIMHQDMKLHLYSR